MENVVVAKGAFHDKVEDSLFICYWAESNKKQERKLMRLFKTYHMCIRTRMERK